MNSLKAMAVMAHLLASAPSRYKTGERPNAEAIGSDVAEAAAELLGDATGLRSFNKKVGEALKIYGPEVVIHRVR